MCRLSILMLLAIINSDFGSQVLKAESGMSLLEIVSAPEDYIQAYFADQKFWHGEHPKDLKEYLNHENDRIAIMAAWRRVVTVLANQQSDERELRKAQERFLGYVEGRFRVAIPEWWQEVLFKTEGDIQFQYYSQLPEASDLYTRDPKSKYFTNDGVSVDFDDNTLLMTDRDRRYRVNLKPIRTPKPLYAGITSITHGRYRLAAVLGYRGRRYHLICVNRSNGELVWQTEIWAAGPIISYTGIDTTPSLCELVVKDDVLYVFGAALDGIYIEAFRIKDGGSLLRFGTAY